MTRKEFEVYRIALEKKKFSRVISDPIEYGIQRSIFRKEKLRKLIGLGRGIDSRTVQAKVQRWRRQLQRLDLSHLHLSRLQKDLEASRLEVSPGAPNPAGAWRFLRATPPLRANP